MRYINSVIFERYGKFLNGLRQNGCGVVRQYCVEDIFNRTYDVASLQKELAENSIQYVSKVLRYPNGAMNNHHWQTTWVWRNFIPVLFKDIELSFEPEKFRLVKKTYKTFDFSYHVHTDPASYQYIDLETGSEVVIGAPEQILDTRYKNPYHQRFIGFHKVCKIKNKTTDTSFKLMINCDSMSIPVIPLLMPFFKEILVLDNRTTKSFKDEIADFLPTHYLALGLVRNFIQYDKKDIDKINKSLYFIINNKIFQHNIQ